MRYQIVKWLKSYKTYFECKDENKVAILIGVTNYSANQNLPNHAIAVYKWGDILYCFDSWGANRNKISTTIFKIIYEMIKQNVVNCKYTMDPIYKLTIHMVYALDLHQTLS